MIFMLSGEGSTLTSIVSEGAMVSVATTTASDSMGVGTVPSRREG